MDEKFSIIFFLLEGNNPFYASITGLVLIILGVSLDVLRKPKHDQKKSSVQDNSKQHASIQTSSISTKTSKNEDESSDNSEFSADLSQRLSGSRSTLLSGLKNFFQNRKDKLSVQSKEWLESFEELLIESDMGVRTSKKLINHIKEKLNTKAADSNTASSDVTPEVIEGYLKESMLSILSSDELPEITPQKVSNLPKVILVVGVNGAGKTTTIGKLAFQYQAQGAKVLIAACDTFRAAAANQLEVWKDRANAEIEKGSENEKPSTVAFRAVHRALKENFDVLLIDTAGRLHTRTNLMNELSGILGIISREQNGAPHETILVVDGSTGQNALQQAREFNAATKLTGIVITKLDGTPKGGIVVAIKDELDIPIRYIGVGESAADLRPFEPGEFVSALLGDALLTDISTAPKENTIVSVDKRAISENNDSEASLG